jgi:RNA polymerase sigma-70 factor (ECF subfamily)
MTTETSSAPEVSDFASFYGTQFARTARSVEAIAGTAAEDVAQEALIAALARWDHVAALKAPDAWVRLVARRIAWRRRGREMSRWDREAAAIPPATVSYDHALSIDLHRAIRGLPGRQRAAIQLHYLADVSVTDVAEILRCRESAAKIWLYRARERLAESLMGHRGRWVSERRWGVDDIVASMRQAKDAAFTDIVLDEVQTRNARWVFTLHDGAYRIETDDGEHLDHGRYRPRGGSIVLTPWNHSGIIQLAPTIDGGRARFSLVSDTTAPTRGVPDEVYLRLLLGADSFAWKGIDREPSSRP